MTTDQLGFGFADSSTTFTGNVIEHFHTGVFADQGDGGTATATLHFNAIHGNDVGADGSPGSVVVHAENNWWGCSKGPNQPGCDTATAVVSFTPWLTRPPKN